MESSGSPSLRARSSHPSACRTHSPGYDPLPTGHAGTCLPSVLPPPVPPPSDDVRGRADDPHWVASVPPSSLAAPSFGTTLDPVFTGPVLPSRTAAQRCRSEPSLPDAPLFTPCLSPTQRTRSGRSPARQASPVLPSRFPRVDFPSPRLHTSSSLHPPSRLPSSAPIRRDSKPLPALSCCHL